MPIHLLTDYLSIFIGMQIFFVLSKNETTIGTRKITYILGALFGAIIGSRLLAALEDPYLFLHPPSLIYYYANKTIIGGIAGGIIGTEIAKRFMGIKKNTGDLAVIPLMVAIIIGRIGCELTGVSDGTIGIPCDLPWCFTQGDPFPRHPLPLYEISFLVTLLPIFSRWITKKRFQDGFVFRIFIISYFGLRFFLEFLKETHPLFLSLTAIQLVTLGFVVFYASDSIRNRLYLSRQ